MPNTESQSNKTLSLSTVVIVFRAPFACGNHYILSAGLKENRAAASWRSARESASWPRLSTGPSVFAQRGFVIVGPQAPSAPPLTLSPKTQVQPGGDQEHTGTISVGDLSTPCRLRKVCYISPFRLPVDGGCVKSICYINTALFIHPRHPSDILRLTNTWSKTLKFMNAVFCLC